MSKPLLILGLLGHGPRSGYELYRILRAHGALYADLKKANLYYLLDRLMQDGYLRVSSELCCHGPRGERLVYEITDAGRARFDELLREVICTYEPVYTGVDAAIVHLRCLPLQAAVTLLEQRRIVVVERRVELTADLRDAHARGTFAAIAADHLVSLIDAELAWLDRSLQRLRGAEVVERSPVRDREG